MENKYGMEIEYDVQVPESTWRHGKKSVYKEIVHDFINSKHEVMKIKSNNAKTANSKRTCIKRFIKPEDSILVMVRGSDVYVVKKGLEMEEN